MTDCHFFCVFLTLSLYQPFARAGISSPDQLLDLWHRGDDCAQREVPDQGELIPRFSAGQMSHWSKISWRSSGELIAIINQDELITKRGSRWRKDHHQTHIRMSSTLSSEQKACRKFWNSELIIRYEKEESMWAHHCSHKNSANTSV